MSRIIGIDYGTKRVGLAVTDLLQIIASPLETVHSMDLMKFLENYVNKECVSGFVVGMPKNLKNEDTNATPHVKQFVNQLKKKFPDIYVHILDERFTSKMALDAMIAGGMKRKDRRDKSNIDKISATIILQSFLETKRI